MGIDIENCEEFRIEHTQLGQGSNDVAFRLHAHREDQAVETTSAPYNQSTHDSFVTAAASGQSAFNTAVTNVLGSWYSGLSSNFKTGFRENFLQQ